MQLQEILLNPESLWRDPADCLWNERCKWTEERGEGGGWWQILGVGGEGKYELKFQIDFADFGLSFPGIIEPISKELQVVLVTYELATDVITSDPEFLLPSVPHQAILLFPPAVLFSSIHPILISL